MISALIVDDHPILRQGLRLILEAANDIEVGGEAADGVEALKKLHGGKFDVVLLDISMPNKDGIDTLKEIMDLHTDAKILILSVYPENKYAVSLMKAGASGYLTKDAMPKQLVGAIRKVVGGKQYASPNLLKLMLEDEGKDYSKPCNLLTNNENKILRLIGSGKQLDEIAETLSLDPRIISFYRINILEKLKLRNNDEIAFYAIQNGLTDRA